MVALMQKTFAALSMTYFPRTSENICILQLEDEKTNSEHISKAWLRKERVQVLGWPACSPDWSQTESVDNSERKNVMLTLCWYSF